MCTRAALAPRIVVGSLVGGQVGPHLQRADGQVPRARAAHRDAQATGAAKATVCIDDGGALTRLRTSGASDPRADHSPRGRSEDRRLMLDRRTGRQYRSGPGERRAGEGGSGPCSAAPASSCAAAATSAREHRARVVGLGVPLHAQHEAVGPAARSPPQPVERRACRSPRDPRRGDRRPGGGGTWCAWRAHPRRPRRACRRSSSTSWSAPSKEPTTRRCS